MITARLAAAVAAASALANCNASNEAYPPPVGASLFAVEAKSQWRLPLALMEVSGLAVTAEGRLLAHDDERAVIHEIDLETARLQGTVTLGEPAIAADFEGVAMDAAGRVYLITSRGRVYRREHGEENANGGFESFDTGLGRACEIEGLAYDQTRDSLIIACKASYDERTEGYVAIYVWSLAAEALNEDAVITIPLQDLTQPIGIGTFSPSGVAVDERTGRLVVVAARENALAELYPDGAVASVRRLSRLHSQPEGVAITAGGALVIADEGGARDRGRITVYERVGDD